MIKRASFLVALGATFASLSACQTQPKMTPATLQKVDAENVAALKSVLAAAMGKSNVEIMEANLITATTISVLPPPPGPFETHSLATPTLFDLVMSGNTCVLIRQDTAEQYNAPALKCRPLKRD